MRRLISEALRTNRVASTERRSDASGIFESPVRKDSNPSKANYTVLKKHMS